VSNLLNNKSILKVAEKISNELKIKMPSKNKIIESLILKIPFIIENEEYQIWIDRYYIAYSSVYQKKINTFI
jgi:hypothetical protein